jgi:lipopolysaccharide export system protein LptA
MTKGYGSAQLWARVVTLAAVAAVAASVTGSPPSFAQQGKGPPNALQGFSTNRGKPVRIKADSLEVRDKDKQAVFSGSVQVIQGDTTLRSKTLAVFYESDPSKPGVPVEKGSSPDGQQQLRRMEAKGGVVVTQKDQTASGDTADFDVRANVVTLNGNVVVARGNDVLRGRRLIVDLTTGVSKVEGGVGGRVDMLLNPSDHKAGDKSGGGLMPQRPPRPN